MTKVQADTLGQQPQSRSDAAVVELPTDVRRRIIARLAELDELARLVRERPRSSRWTA